MINIDVETQHECEDQDKSKWEIFKSFTFQENIPQRDINLVLTFYV